MQPIARSLTPMLTALAPVALLVAGISGAAVAAETMDHSQHQMTAEQIATLKSKVPLYVKFTDEQINRSMTMMPPDTEAYISSESVRDHVGILALSHGYFGDGNEQFKAGYAKVATVHPTAVGLGMAMMTSGYIQTAIDNLEAAGAKTIVVLPTEIGELNPLVRQWRYILGLRQESAFLDVPRVQTKAKILMAETPTNSPIVARILAENLKTVSKDPAREVALLIMHGQDNEQDNEPELRNLGKQAAAVQKLTGISDVFYASLQDDAPPEIRAANVKRMRDWVENARASGKSVLVAPVLMTRGGTVTKRIAKDLDALTYTVVDKGITEHPLFDVWVRETVAAELKKAG